jgi:hypothetical protein
MFNINTRRECDWIGPLILAVTLVSIAVLRFWMIKSDKSGASAAVPLPTRILRQADDPSASARSDAAAPPESATSFVEEFQSVLLLKTASKLPEAGQLHSSITQIDTGFFESITRLFRDSAAEAGGPRITHRQKEGNFDNSCIIPHPCCANITYRL